MMRYIKRFWKVASDRCKTYTIGALVLLIIFVGIDIYEFTLNNKAETEIENTANSVFDSLVQEIESMEPEMWIPFAVLVVIDITEILLTFS